MSNHRVRSINGRNSLARLRLGPEGLLTLRHPASLLLLARASHPYQVGLGVVERGGRTNAKDLLVVAANHRRLVFSVRRLI